MVPDKIDDLLETREVQQGLYHNGIAELTWLDGAIEGLFSRALGPNWADKASEIGKRVRKMCERLGMEMVQARGRPRNRVVTEAARYGPPEKARAAFLRWLKNGG